MEQIMEKSLSHLLNGFRGRHPSEDVNFNTADAEERLISQFQSYSLDLTHFYDPFDTYLYSRLISKALLLSSEVDTIVDFGAGSSIPTLLALKKFPDRAIKVIAVDVDREALRVSQDNVERMGLSDRYTFVHGHMTKVIQELELHSRMLLVSNPPYIPVPGQMNDYFLLPVNGGEDGAQLILDLLNHSYPEGLTLALLWGSLCHPAKVIDAMEKSYDVLQTQWTRIRFGQYTSQPLLKEHLYQLREGGLIHFDSDCGEEMQSVIGSIIRKISVQRS